VGGGGGRKKGFSGHAELNRVGDAVSKITSPKDVHHHNVTGEKKDRGVARTERAELTLGGERKKKKPEWWARTTKGGPSIHSMVEFESPGEKTYGRVHPYTLNTL